MRKIFAFMCCISLIAPNSPVLSPESAGLERMPSIVPSVLGTAFNPALKSTDHDAKTHMSVDNSVYQIQIVAGGQSFDAVLYKNETTDALMDRLPMTIDMEDMNKNEKYYYLSDHLPTNSKKSLEVHSGDLMIYGTDCLVLFYENFPSPYSYTPLGVIEDVSGLKDALGNENVLVSFRVHNSI